MPRTAPDPVRAAFDPFWLVLLLLFPILVFPNLGNAYLWQDEGETAVLAQCVLLHGYPLAHDGRQVVSDQADQRDLKAGVWIWTPWLSLYTAAASFLFLGESTWSARLPFALAAWAAVLVAYPVFWQLSGSRRVSRFAAVLLATSVPLLLHARQCRYYSLFVLFCLLHLWGYLRILRGARFGVTLLVVGGAGLAQTFLPQLAASTAALAVHALWLVKDRSAQRKYFVASLAVALISLPFFLYTASWARDYQDAGHGFDSPGRFMASLRSYLLMSHAYGWPFLLAIPLVWMRLPGRSARPLRSRMGLLAITLVCLFAFGTPPGPAGFGASWVLVVGLTALGVVKLWRLRGTESAAADWRPLSALLLAVSILAAAALNPYPFFRYLLGLLPLLALWTAYTAGELVRWNAVGVAVLGGLLIGTNLLAQGPWVAIAGLQGPEGSERFAWVDGAMAYGHRPSNIPAVNVGRFTTTEQPWSFSPLRDYVGEISHDYDGPVEAVVGQLRAHAKPNEVLLTTYEHFPLIFYTDLLVLKPEQAGSLPALPEWVFLHSPRVPRLPPAVAAALGTSYDRVTLGAREVRWENIPEPYWHFYRTRTDGREVVLLRRKARP